MSIQKINLFNHPPAGALYIYALTRVYCSFVDIQNGGGEKSFAPQRFRPGTRTSELRAKRRLRPGTRISGVRANPSRVAVASWQASPIIWHSFLTLMYTGPVDDFKSSVNDDKELSSHVWAFRSIVNQYRPLSESDDPATEPIVALLVRNDLDSLCAAVLLQVLLRGQRVPSYLWPIVNDDGIGRWTAFTGQDRRQVRRVHIVPQEAPIVPFSYCCCQYLRLSVLFSLVVQENPYGHAF